MAVFICCFTKNNHINICVDFGVVFESEMLNIYARSPEAIDWSDTRCTANRVIASKQSKSSCSRCVREYSVEGVRHLQQNGHVLLHVIQCISDKQFIYCVVTV